MQFFLALRRFRALQVLTVGAGVGALVSGALAQTYGVEYPEAAAYFRLIALIYGLGVIVLPLLQALLDARIDGQRASERVETLVVVNAATLPIVNRLATIGALPQPQRAAHAEAVREACLASALRMVGAEDGRASYYRVSGSNGSRAMQNPMTRSGKRLDTPTTRFVEGESLNREVWPLIDEGDGSYYPDLRRDHPTSWPTDYTPAFQCFISVGVRAGDVVFGMLTINSLKPRRLTTEDFATMQVLGALLATAEAMCEGTTGLNRIRATR